MWFRREFQPLSSDKKSLDWLKNEREISKINSLIYSVTLLSSRKRTKGLWAHLMLRFFIVHWGSFDVRFWIQKQLISWIDSSINFIHESFIGGAPMKIILSNLGILWRAYMVIVWFVYLGLYYFWIRKQGQNKYVYKTVSIC